MSKIIKWLLIVFILFSSTYNVSALLSPPTWLQLVKEVIDPNQWPTKFTFNFDLLESIDRYKIYCWEEIWAYEQVGSPIKETPTTFLKWWVKWDIFYCVIKWSNIWSDTEDWEFSAPVKVVVGWETSKINNNDIIDNNEDEMILPEPTQLPTTWPEHILLGFISIIFWSMIMFRKNILN